MGDIVKPKIDLAFKKLFTDANNEDILKGFLAAILEVGTKDITHIQILNPEITPDEMDGKFIRLDLNLMVNNKEMEFEIQLRNLGDYRERSAYYFARKFSGQLKRGEDYKELKQTICVNILDFNLFDTSDYCSKFTISDMEHNEILTDKCSIQFFELKKVGKIPAKNDPKKLWMQFINAESEGDLEMLENTNVKEIVKGCRVIRDYSSDAALRARTLQREKALRDEISALGNARLEGRKEGIGIGRKEGIGIGRKEGIGIGRKEGVLRLIEKLKESGVDEAELAKAAESVLKTENQDVE